MFQTIALREADQFSTVYVKCYICVNANDCLNTVYPPYQMCDINIWETATEVYSHIAPTSRWVFFLVMLVLNGVQRRYFKSIQIKVIVTFYQMKANIIYNKR